MHRFLKIGAERLHDTYALGTIQSASKYDVYEEVARLKRSGKPPTKQLVGARKNMLDQDSLVKVKLPHDELLLEFDGEEDASIFALTIRRLLTEFTENFAHFDDEDGGTGIGMMRIDPALQEALFAGIGIEKEAAGAGAEGGKDGERGDRARASGSRR